MFGDFVWLLMIFVGLLQAAASSERVFPRFFSRRIASLRDLAYGRGVVTWVVLFSLKATFLLL